MGLLDGNIDSSDTWKICLIIFLYVAQTGLFITTDLLVIEFHNSAETYCDNTYDVSTNFYSYSLDCIGDIDGCNSDDRCYTTGEEKIVISTYDDYCSSFCECCTKESYYAYLVTCWTLVGFAGLTFVLAGLVWLCNHKLRCCTDNNDTATVACMLVMSFLGHFVAFIIIACDQEFQVSEASTAHTMAIVAAATAGFELLMCVCAVGVALREEDTKYEHPSGNSSGVHGKAKNEKELPATMAMDDVENKILDVGRNEETQAVTEA